MQLHKDQLLEAILQAVKGDDPMNELMKLTFETLMLIERDVFIKDQPSQNKSNGFRPGRHYGHGKQKEFKIPRDRLGVFYPQLLTVLKDEQIEKDELAGVFYTMGLTQMQIGDVFEKIYGRHYSKASISRMIEGLRQEVDVWLKRPLECYYPIVYIDAIHIKVHRNNSVETEAFYVVLGVKSDLTREVLTIENIPQESATGWKDILEKLKKQGVKKVDLFVADGLTGLETAIATTFSMSNFQKCVTHLKRQVIARVRSSDKLELAEDLKEVFQMDNTADTKNDGFERWLAMCRKWSNRKYSYFKNIQNRAEYQYYFTYLDYHPSIRRMIYTTNWIERLNKDFRRVLRMRSAMPDDESVIVLMAGAVMNKEVYNYPVTALKGEKKFHE